MIINRNGGGLFLMTVIVSMVSLMFIGCDTDGAGVGSGSGSGDAEPPKALSFTFHRPKKFSVAITRIRELHDAITSNDPLPSPIEYQVVEIVHGEGVSAHSHYYLHENDEAGKAAADDGHVTTAENVLDVKVKPIDEQKDLIRWLPKIASAGDMPESDWSKVNAISKEMTPQLYTIVEASTDDDKRRASYCEHSDSFSNHISSLEELAK